MLSNCSKNNAVGSMNVYIATFIFATQHAAVPLSARTCHTHPHRWGPEGPMNHSVGIVMIVLHPF